MFALIDVLAMLKVEQKFWDGAEYVGACLQKAFGRSRRRTYMYFQGEVASYDYAEKLYLIKYEDGDREEMTKGEVEELLHGETAAATAAAAVTAANAAVTAAAVTAAGAIPIRAAPA